MRMLRATITVCLVFFILASAAVADTWLNYTTANRVYDIAQEGDYIWCATRGGVFRWHRQHGTYTRYTTIDGLADNHVNEVFIASNGTKWFRTLSGVSCFDGLTWKSYTEEDGLAFYYVDVMQEDKNGVMWFGTRNGVSRFDGTTWITDTSISLITGDNMGRLWFETSEGIKSYDGTNWILYGEIADYISSIIEDEHGVLWFGATDGIYRLEGEEWTYYQTEYVRDMVFDHNNVLWFIKNSRVASLRDSIITVYTEEDELPDASYHSLTMDKNGVIWAISDDRDGGVLRHDATSWASYTTEDGLANYNVYTVFADDEGVMWFGTFGGGMSSFDGTEWKTYSTHDGPAYNEIGGLFEDIGILIDDNGVKWFWFHYNGGVVSRFDGTTWSNFNSDEVPDEIMEQKYVKDSEGRLWRCQGKGSVGIFNGTEWVTMYPDGGGVLEGIIFDIMKDSDGNIWLASENGIGCYDGVNWTFYLPGEVLPQSKWGTLSVYTITQDHDGVIWFGTEIGIMNLNRNTWNFYDSEVTEIGSEHVYSSAVDNNNVKWFGFWRGGVARFDGENWINFTTKDGLCSNTVNDITVDHDGSIWFGTGNGISVLREDDTGVIESLDTLPEVLTLSKNYPNPFNPTTTIEFSLPSSGFTSFIIYNIMGQKVRELLADNLHHGTHSVVWDGKDDNGKPVSSGIYISMVRCGKHYAVQQMTHIK